MKKLVVSLLMTMMCVTFVGCSDKKETKEETKQEIDAEDTADEDVETDTDVDADSDANTDTDADSDSNSAEGLTVEKFVAENKEVLQSQTDQSNGVNLSVEARGNSLVYIYKFPTDSGMSSEDLKTQLDSAMEAQKDIMLSTLDAAKTDIPDLESIITEYLDMNGEVITSMEFK